MLRNCIQSTVLILLAFLITCSAEGKHEDKFSNRLTAMDVFNLQHATDPQISSDGKHIVYVRQFSDVMKDKRESNLWIVSVDGSDNRALTTGNYSDSSPRWSPDGTRIAYISDREGKPQIYVRWMDSGQTAALTNLESAPKDIVWSPDGKLISFSSLVPVSRRRLPRCLKLLRGRNGLIRRRSMITSSTGSTVADPQARLCAAVRYFCGRRSAAPAHLPFGGTESPLAGSASKACWTPDGKYLIFSANLHPDYEYDLLNTEVYELSLADGSWKALTRRKGPDNSPAISPDGKVIAYVGFDDRYQGHQTTHLYLMNRDGSNARVATSNLDRDVQNPQWAKDGSGVYFLYDDQGDTKLAFYSLVNSF